MSQLTSPTTCYSGCRQASGFFASETHSLHCVSNVDGDVALTSGSLPSPQGHDRRSICVGHDQCGAWELFSFLDPPPEEASAGHQHQLAESMASLSSLPEITVDPSPGEAQVADPPVAWIAIRSRETLAPTCTASLTYRPLSPLLMNPLNHRTEDESRVVVWVGSADDAKLRCYISDHNNHEVLRPVDLSQDVFTFASPVMVMDSLRRGQSYVLAVGCQDGTVRVITFQCHRAGDTLSFTNITAHAVIVDGPIMSLHISQQENASMQLVVGSMCGFVCRLQKKKTWEGPWMVAEGLWNSRLESEDAVLAVHMLSKDMVAVGTHSGRCLVWQKREETDDSYRLVWECQLPYSIHGLAHIATAQPCLLVTTRHTFHVFQQQVPKYSASTAKRRIQELISQRKVAETTS